jgi:nucleoside-diphosphate kinase
MFLSMSHALHHVYLHVLLSSTLINYITSGPVVAIELMGIDAVNKWRNLLGPTDSSAARERAPISIRARYGVGKCPIK